MTAPDIVALNERFEKAHPQEILQFAAETWGEKLAVVTSFQPTGIVTLHLLTKVAPQIPVLTLDTGLLFTETYALMNQLEKDFHLRLVRIVPEQTVEQQAAEYGANLWQRDPDRCCHLRKVIPLSRGLHGYDAWITGLRRDQSPERANTPIFEWDARNQRVKISALATWTEDMVWAYIEAYELPYNLLHDKHYPTIGCYPCTQPVEPGNHDLRAGRWAGRSKTECGIHTAELTIVSAKDS